MEQIQGVGLLARWVNLEDLWSDPSEALVTSVVEFLRNAVATVSARGGRIQYLNPDRFFSFFAEQGKVGETEIKVVEAGRRMLLDARRFNSSAKAPVDFRCSVVLGTVQVVDAPPESGTDQWLIGPAWGEAEKLIAVAGKDSITVSEEVYRRVNFFYKGRPLDGKGVALIL